MSGPTPREDASADEADASQAEVEAEAPGSLEALAAAGDADGLMELARRHREGDGVPRDMQRCFDCYEAAAALGHPQAAYGLALFHLDGRLVARNDKEAAKHIRAAADAGYLPAKVHLANLYELGIHYKQDADKADVWYRNAARTAKIDAEAGTPEHTRALAELGSVRHCLQLCRDDATSDDDKARFMKKARRMGHREPGEIDERSSLISSPGLEPEAAPDAPRAAAAPAKPVTKPVARTDADSKPDAERAKPDEKEAKPERAPKPRIADWNDGFTAFFFALVCVGAAFAGAHAVRVLSAEELGPDHPLPLVGAHVELVLPILLGAIGALPTLVLYRGTTFVRALTIAALATLAGEIAFIEGAHLVPDHVLQLSGFGAAGFLAGLLVLGVLGGTRSGYKARHLARIMPNRAGRAS